MRGEEYRHTKYPLSLFTYLTTRHLGLLRGDLADSRPWAGPACQNMPSLSCPGTCIREREPIQEWNHWTKVASFPSPLKQGEPGNETRTEVSQTQYSQHGARRRSSVHYSQISSFPRLRFPCSIRVTVQNVVYRNSFPVLIPQPSSIAVQQ